MSKGRGVPALLLLLTPLSFSFALTFNYSAYQVIEGLKRAFLNNKPLLIRAGVQGLAIYLATDIITTNSEYGELSTSISYCIAPAPSCINLTQDAVLNVSDCTAKVVNVVQNTTGAWRIYVPCSQTPLPAGTYICGITSGGYGPFSYIYPVSCSSGYYFRFFDVYSYINPVCSIGGATAYATAYCSSGGVANWTGCPNNAIEFVGTLPSCSKLGASPINTDIQRLQDLLTNIANYTVPDYLQDDLDLAFQDTSGAILETGEAVIVPPTDQLGEDIIVLPFPDTGTGTGSGTGTGTGTTQTVRIEVDPSDITAINEVADNTYDPNIDIPEKKDISGLIQDLIANSPLLRWVQDVHMDISPGECSIEGTVEFNGVSKPFILDFCPLEPYLNQIGTFILAFAHLYALYIVFRIN